jgi:hypothetical protein
MLIFAAVHPMAPFGKQSLLAKIDLTDKPVNPSVVSQAPRLNRLFAQGLGKVGV